MKRTAGLRHRVLTIALGAIALRPTAADGRPRLVDHLQARYEICAHAARFLAGHPRWIDFEGLLRQVRSGDDEAKSVMSAKLVLALTKYLRRNFRVSDDKLEELVTEGVAQIMRKQGQFRDSGEAKFTTWAYRVALNRARDVLRSDRSRGRQEPVSLDDAKATSGAEPATLDSGSGELEIYDALERLPQKERDALRALADGHSVEEYGVQVGLSYQAALRVVRRARTMLTTELERR